jgi:phage shock protein A
MDEAIAEEIAAMEQDYQAKADAYLQSLQAQQQELSAAKLQELDHRLEEKLAQVDSLYAAKKDQWADTILERIIGKAGG